MRSDCACIRTSTRSRTTTWFSRLAATINELLPSNGSIETRSLGPSASPRLCMRSRIRDSSLGAISRADPESSVSTSISTAEFIGVSESRSTRSSIERRSSGLAATSSELVRGSVITSGRCRRATSAGRSAYRRSITCSTALATRSSPPRVTGTTRMSAASPIESRSRSEASRSTTSKVSLPAATISEFERSSDMITACSSSAVSGCTRRSRSRRASINDWIIGASRDALELTSSMIRISRKSTGTSTSSLASRSSKSSKLRPLVDTTIEFVRTSGTALIRSSSRIRPERYCCSKSCRITVVIRSDDPCSTA